ncbi:hypothetical protein [Microbacterium sp. KNMS]
MTVRQPWAWAIIHGGKDVENRSRNIAGAYRGPVAIHAGQNLDLDAFSSPLLHRAWVDAGGDEAAGGWGAVHRGAIIGVVDLVGVHGCSGTPLHDPCCYEIKPDGFTEAIGSGAGMCSPWADTDSDRHLVLRDPRALAEPIAFKGALGLRELDGETTARVLAGIAA